MSRWLLASVALFAVYLPVALWSKLSYADRTPKGRTVVMLTRPFERFGTTGAIARMWLPFASKLDGADSADNRQRSPVLLYEDGKLLGPAHSLHRDIAELGHGHYSHWQGVGIIFSASDNSDPNSNWRHYWAVLPE